MAYSRNEYLKSLNRMRSNYQNQGNVLINTEDDSTNVGQEMSSFAYMNTPVPAPVEEAPKEEPKKDFWSQLFGTIDEVAANFGAGFVGAWEGILDLGATGLGALGNATGWYDGDVFTDWAKQDIGTALAEWTKTYANLTPWAIVGNITSGNYSDPEYFKDMFEGAKDILGSALFMDNEIKDYRQDADKYYQFDDEYDTGVGEFLGQAAHTIGFMLPSIMTGGIASGAGLGNIGAKLISTGSMALMAGGKGSEEALKEGADAGEALAYGALSGAIEAGTEWIPFPAGNAVGGVIGGKLTGKTFKSIVKNMLEEGTEEAISQMLNPLIKGITYDSEAFESYADINHYGEVLKAFGSGAIMGGVFSGVHMTTMRKNLGKDGVTVVEDMSAMQEKLTEAQKKYKKGKISESQFNSIVDETQKDILEIKKRYDSLPEKYKTAVNEMFLDPKGFSHDLKNYGEYIKTNENRKLKKAEVLEYRAERAKADTIEYFERMIGENKGSLNVPLNVPSSVYTKDVKMPSDLSEVIKDNADQKAIQSLVNSWSQSDSRNNYVMSYQGKTIVVQPFDDGGTTKYGLITINQETNEITNIDVKATKPSGEKAYIVPKNDETKLLKTRLEGKDGTANIYSADVFYDDDLGAQYSINAKPTARSDENAIFIYSENPLDMSKIAKTLSFDEVSRIFNIPKSMEKTYKLKLENKNELEIFKWIAKRANLTIEEVLNKLGYDAIIKKDKSVTFFDASNILKRGIEYGKQGTYDYSHIVKRNVSEDTIRKLEEYSRKDGKELETEKEALRYETLIRETLNYTNRVIEYRGKKYKVRIIKPNAYTPDMKEIINEAKKIGVKVSFSLKMQEPSGMEIDNVSAYWSSNKNEIIVFVAAKRRGTLAQTGKHELAHAVFDRLHGMELLNVEEKMRYLKNKYPQEFNEKLALYKAQWFHYEQEFELPFVEEMFADTYAGLCKWQDTNFTDNLVKEMNDLFDKGTKWANNKYYRQLAEDEIKSAESSYDYSETDINAISQGSKSLNISSQNLKKAEMSPIDKKVTIGLAVTYDEAITNDTFEKQITKYKPYVERRVRVLEKLLGVKIDIGEAIGGWTFTDNANKVVLAGEPSFPLTITNYKSIEDVKLIGALLADLSYEVQNSVGVFEYDINGDVMEDIFYLTRVDEGLNDIIKKAGLEGFTLEKNNKKLTVVGANDDIIEILLNDLNNGGYLDGEGHEANICKANWLGLKERANLYEVWLENEVEHQDGRLRNYVTKASKINKYILNHLDESGYRLPNTENNASKILKLLENERVTQREIIKDSANLRHNKVYSLKTTSNIIDNVLTNMLNKWDNAIKITIPQGKTKLVNWTFEELNLSKNKITAIENIVDQIESAVVTFDNGVNGKTKVVLKDLHMREDLIKAIKGLTDHKGDLSEKSKWVRKYYDTLNRYANYVHRRALLTSAYLTARSQQDQLNRIFENTKQLKMGGDATVPEISFYKNLISNVRWTRSNKNVAPSTFTKLVNNFVNYTEENYKEFFDPDLKAMVEMLSESFEDGKFPQREPTLEEMHLFNSIRGRIIKRCNELASQRSVERRNAVKNTVVNVSVTLPYTRPDSYGALKRIVESTISLPSYFENTLGAQNKFTKLFTVEWLKNWSNSILEENRQNNYVFDTLAKEAGFKNPRDLAKELKKSVYTLNDRSGKPVKIKMGYIASAYLTYNSSSRDQLLTTGLTIKNDAKTSTDIDFKITEEQYIEMFDKLPTNVKNWLDLVSEKYMNDMLYKYRSAKNEHYFGVPLLKVDVYFPSQRVGQVNMGIAPQSSLKSGYLSIVNAGSLKKRVKNKNHFVWSEITDIIRATTADTAHWGEMAEWVDQVNMYLNTTIPEAGNHTLEYYLSKYAPDWKNTWSQYMSKLVLGVPILEKNHTFLSAIGNAGQLATLGLNIGSVLRQLGSANNWVFDNRVSLKTQIKAFFTGFKNFFRYNKIKKELELNNGFFVNRWESDDLLRSYLNGGQLGKFQRFIGKITLHFMEVMDRTVILTQGYEIATTIVNEEIKNGLLIDSEGNPIKKGSNEYKKAVSDLLAELVVRTQSNSVSMWQSRLRSGDTGWITRDVFGRFGSDNQNRTQAIMELFKGVHNSRLRVEALERASRDETYTPEQREEFRNQALAERNYYQKRQVRRIVNNISSLVLNSIAMILILELVKRIKGKKDWDEELDPEELFKNFVSETLFNWIPYIGTLSNAITNNSDVSSFTLEKVNNLIDFIKILTTAVESGKETEIRRAFVNLIKNGLEVTGIPANNLYQLFTGVWYWFDKEGSLEAQNWVKGYSSTNMKSQYTTYVKEGQTKRAKAQLGAWSSMYSTNITDGSTLDELVRLASVGYNVAPSANMTTYEDELGQTVKMTSAQSGAFKVAFAKVNAQLSEIIKIEAYKTADDKTKASMINRINTAYRDFAKAKALGVAPNSKLAKLLYYTNGDVDLARYIAHLQSLSVIKEDKRNTRKENVIAEINKLRGLSKAEKLLLAYLSGYSVSEKNQSTFVNYLMSVGFSNKEAKEFANIK